MPASKRERYRVEDGRSCIDIHLKSSRQLFDLRDPAPFHDRDLDQDAVEYIVGAAQEIPAARPLRIVLVLSEEPEPRLDVEVIRTAVQTHFTYAREQLDRKLRLHLRNAQVFLAIGTGVLAVFLTLAELTAGLPQGGPTNVLREGLVITGWIAMWRPLELLLYDWWPLAATRRLMRRILAADVQVRYGPAAAMP